ncbi:MAG: tetraacyldisaccharide 4'-kinase [Nitrospira sp.]|nr:tetraacyldisaccharide 4'-kinase [Nitrospira sp.]
MALLHPGRPVRKSLYGVAFLYGLIVRLRNACYRFGWCRSSRVACRVVSVGNLTVGGTGKTPVVILLTQWLQSQGRRVAVLSRGYKRASGGSQRLVSDGVTVLAGPSEAGDEPFLLARRCPEAVVAVGADRAALGQWILAQYPVDCMILDDGFQHRGLRRDVDLVLLDATDATGLDAMAPAGRLREPLQGLVRATAVVVTRADSKEEVEPPVEGRDESVIPGNYEWVSRIVRGHSNLRRHLTPLPYLRAWQRLCRSLAERRETADEDNGKALLDRLYASSAGTAVVGKR